MATELSKTSLTKINGSIDLVGISISSCSFLATDYDHVTPMAFAHPANRCYKNQVGKKTQLQHQRSFCLTDRYEECVIFQQEKPPAVKTDAQDRQKRSFGSKLALTSVIVLITIAAVISLSLL